MSLLPALCLGGDQSDSCLPISMNMPAYLVSELGSTIELNRAYLFLFLVYFCGYSFCTTSTPFLENCDAGLSGDFNYFFLDLILSMPELLPTVFKSLRLFYWVEYLKLLFLPGIYLFFDWGLFLTPVI